MTDAPLLLALLLAWGALAGLDLVSWPQLLLGRPLVAATVTGALLGDVGAGLRVGVVLELFALDVLPVGAVRYPDYGPATVAGVAAAAGRAPDAAIAVGVPLALVLALAGGYTHTWMRAANGRAIQRLAGELGTGSAAAIARLQRRGLITDALRAAAVTAAGLGAALGLRVLVVDPTTARMLAVTVSGAGLAAAAGGALRTAGRGTRLRWLAAGVGAGAVVAAFR